jgi:hypothetical protein
MTSQTLSRVTLETLKNYRVAATQTVAAYRLGSHRLLDVVNGALKNSVYPRTAKMAPRVTDRMNEVRGSVSKIFVKGIDQVAERTEQVIELGSTTAATQVSKVAEFAAGIDNQILASGLQTAARLTMPGAKLGLVLSGKVAEGAHALADAAGGRSVRSAVRKATPIANKTKATVKSATRRATRSAKAPMAKAQRAVRGAKKAVRRAVAA